MYKNARPMHVGFVLYQMTLVLQLPGTDRCLKKKLRDNWEAIVSDLESELVLDYLYQEGVLHRNEFETIQMMKKTEIRHDVTRKLLSMLERKSPEVHAIQILLKAFENKRNYPHLAQLLRDEPLAVIEASGSCIQNRAAPGLSSYTRCNPMQHRDQFSLEGGLRSNLPVPTEEDSANVTRVKKLESPITTIATLSDSQNLNNQQHGNGSSAFISLSQSACSERSSRSLRRIADAYAFNEDRCLSRNTQGSQNPRETQSIMELERSANIRRHSSMKMHCDVDVTAIDISNTRSKSSPVCRPKTRLASRSKSLTKYDRSKADSCKQQTDNLSMMSRSRANDTKHIPAPIVSRKALQNQGIGSRSAPKETSV